MYKKQKEDVEQTKIRENYLKTINKTLRDEMRKIKKAQDDIINIEYLRNVIIKFLERKNTQVSLELKTKRQLATGETRKLNLIP